MKAGELERYVALAARDVAEWGGILILLDADDDCPATLGPGLETRALAARGDRKIAVVVAKREFEAWFLAGASSLRGQRGFPGDLQAPTNPEEIRGAKEWLAARMSGASYSPTVDQPALAAILDLEATRASAPSFDKWCREIGDLLRR
ncbi:MAG: DUF4276 family protein [Actinomycetota bacterium]